MSSDYIPRLQFGTFIDITPASSSTYKLLNDGVKTAEVERNPDVLEETYIGNKNSSAYVRSYKTKMPVTMTARKGDPAFDFLFALYKAWSIGNALKTTVVNVYLEETPSLNYYSAEQFDVVVAFAKYGGPGGQENMLDLTLHYSGDARIGAFNPNTRTFVADPIIAGLASITIGALVLSPVFDTNQLFYSTSTATTPQTMSSVAVDAANAVIVQKNGVTTVTQGGSATLALGLNILTFQVTNGTEVVTYTVNLTKTA